MKKKVKLFSPDQAHNVSELILSISAKAYIRGEIGEEEKDAIIDFTAQCEAFLLTLKEQGLIPPK